MQNDSFRNLKMQVIHENIPFQTIDWSLVPEIEHKGEAGTSSWKTVQFGGLRIRIVEYSDCYLADHWCQKGHIVYCLEGEFVTERENGEKTVLKEGMTYVVSDEQGSHRSIAETGVKLLIIDGDFLQRETAGSKLSA